MWTIANTRIFPRFELCSTSTPSTRWRISTIGDPTGSSIQGHTSPISRGAATPLGAHPLAWGRCLYNFSQRI